MARRWNDIEIVSVDSMQLYREMDIGTGKPSVSDRNEIPHHLLDVADPGDEFSVAEFQTQVARAIEEIERRGRRALLVGGTGLYLRAVVDNFTIPGEFPAVREEIEAEPDTAALHRRLRTLDPAAASRMEPDNRRRVVRALEVTVGSGRPFSSFGPGLGLHPSTRFALAGVWLPRTVVNARIEARFDAMLAGGLLDEVHRLAARPLGLSRTARQALGYRELLAHVEGGTQWDQARADAIRRTRQFARRQRVWFRRDPRLVWHGAPSNPFAVLPALLGDWKVRCQH